MNISVVVIIIGAAFLAIGLIGGGIKIGVKEGEASIPTLNPTTRVVSFIIGASFIVFGIWQELNPQTFTTAIPTNTSASSQSQIDSISGTWVGTAKNGDYEFDATFIIGNSCSIGTVCGTFDFPKISCSGTLTIIRVDGNLFEFRANDKTSGCLIAPEVQDTLQLLPDGTLLYVSKRSGSDQTRGILSKKK